MLLEETYAKPFYHDWWEQTYRAHPLQDKLNAKVVRQLQIPEAGYVLDAGCGTGYYTHKFASLGHRVVAVDISEYALSLARRRLAESGLLHRVTFLRSPLELLDWDESSLFDLVHCRGVLMHIPEWEKVLARLCRLPKENGKILIVDSNHLALEFQLVKLVRLFRHGESRARRTPGGIEFWTNDGTPFVWRVADQGALMETLSANGIQIDGRFGAEFWDVNRFPHCMRKMAMHWNALWYSFGLPVVLSSGVGILGTKRAAGR